MSACRLICLALLLLLSSIWTAVYVSRSKISMDMEIQDDADNERDRFLRLRFSIYLFIVPKALRDSPYFSLRQ